MTVSTTVRALQTASKAVHHLGLRDAGFRRQGNHLHRKMNDLIHAVHFQASQWGSSDGGRFTVNLVVTCPFLYTIWTGRDFPKNPASTLFPVTSRIGRLMPARRDHWWEVDALTDQEALSRDVVAVVLEFGVPFFDAFQSTEVMLARLRLGNGLPGLTEAQCPLVHAMLAVQKGARDEASKVLCMARIAAGTSPFLSTVQSIGDRLRIPLG